MVDDIVEDSKDGEYLHLEDTPVRQELEAQGADDNNIENDPIYVEGEEEVEETIEDVEEDDDNEEDDDDEEEMEDDTKTEEDEQESSFYSSEEEDEAQQEVKKKTQAKGMKRIVVTIGPSIDFATSFDKATPIDENIARPEVKILETIPIIRTRDNGLEQMDTEMGEEVHVTLIGIVVHSMEEVRTEIEEENGGSVAMIPNSIEHVPTIEGVTALRLEIELQLNTMPMAWACQNQVMTKRENGFYYD